MVISYIQGRFLPERIDKPVGAHSYFQITPHYKKNSFFSLQPVPSCITHPCSKALQMLHVTAAPIEIGIEIVIEATFSKRQLRITHGRDSLIP